MTVPCFVPPLSAPADSGPDARVLQARLADLETYQGHDIEANLADAIAIEEDAGRIGDIALAQRARLVRADMIQRKGEVTEAARIFIDVHRWAEANDSVVVRARSHFHLALTFHYLGDEAASLEHSIASVESLDDDAPVALRILHLIRLANSLAGAGSLDAARLRYEQAERMAVRIGDLTRQLLILNNLAYTEYESDQLDRAQRAAERMWDVAATLDRDFLIVERDTIANIHIAAGDYRAAEAILQSAVHAPQWFEVHDFADAALTLATAQRLGGALGRAARSLDQCLDLCEQHDLAGVRVRALVERAELFAAGGQFRAAYEQYKQYHAESEKQRSQQQEARARTRQALFEVAEAKQAAHYYREQARRDPLTKLFNRRFVDEELPAAIADAERTARALTVALVDLDHFKQVNDKFSHQIGDEVLSATAHLLNRHSEAVPGGFAARLGGEEFLIVLPGHGTEEARRLLEVLREVIAVHPWPSLAAGLQVTASFGGSVLDPHTLSRPPAPDGAPTTEDLMSRMLAEADRHLYEAKAGGRNRVVL